MSIFNRIFRTKSNISRVEICRYKPRFGIAPQHGVEIQLHHIIRGRNLVVILPLNVVEQLPGFRDENNRFSKDLLSGCNFLLEIQKTASYNQKKADIERKKKELAKAGVNAGGKVGEEQLAIAQDILSRRIKEEKRLREELAKKQRLMKRR